MRFFQLLLIFSIGSCFGQSPDRNYKEMVFAIPKYPKSDSQGYKKLRSQAVAAKDYFPDKFSNKDDGTDFLQKALDENKVVILPNYPILINETGISLHSGQRILFQNKSQLVLKPNAEPRYEVLRIHNVQDVEVYYPNLVGDRDSHKSSEGEWGFGISIRSSDQVKIHNPVITKMWGDGLYIGQIDNKTSSNISVQNGFIDKSRRNGVSITSGREIKLNNMFISNTYGTDPSSAIDIEPNSGRDLIDNIFLTNIKTANNKEGGLLVVLHEFKQPKNKISIWVDNLSDTGSGFGLGFKGLDQRPDNSSQEISGEVSLKNMNLTKSRIPYKFFKSYRSKLDFRGDAGVVKQILLHIQE